MSEEAIRLHDDLMNSSELADALKDVMEHGTPGEQVKAAHALGYNISLEDVQTPQMEEVDDEDLEAVSGGIFTSGVDAADGHEVGCRWWWYHDWAEASLKCCPNGNDTVGYEHDYEELEREMRVGKNDNVHDDRFLQKDYFYSLHLQCKRCGYELFI